MWKRLFLGIFILLAFEVGLFLLMFPWSQAWEKNYFLNGIGPLQDVAMSPFVRGAVSGLGLVNVLLAIGEAWHFRDRIRDLESREAEEAARLTLEKT
jgi:hypothetical protein